MTTSLPDSTTAITTGNRRHHYRGVIFDLDGTLIDSAPDLRAALNLRLEAEGLDPLPVDQVRLMIGAGVPKLIQRGFAARGVKLTLEDIEARHFKPFVEYYDQHATDLTALYPGAEAALEALQAQDIKIGLCTNKPTEAARIILDQLGVAGHFHTIIGGTSGFAKKPDPAVVFACLEAMAVEPKAAFYVGDSETDVTTARNANLPIVVVSGGYTATPVEQLGADVAIGSLMDLAPVLPTLARQAFS